MQLTTKITTIKNKLLSNNNSNSDENKFICTYRSSAATKE